MLIIAGYIQMDPATRNEFVEGHVDLVRRGRLAPGCLDLAISADAVQPDRVNNYELWDNEEDLAAWRGIAHPPKLNIEFLGGEMVRYDISGTAPLFG